MNMKMEKEKVEFYSTMAIERVMDNLATALIRVGDSYIITILKNIDGENNVKKQIHAVVTIELTDNDVDVSLFHDWAQTKIAFGKLVRES